METPEKKREKQYLTESSQFRSRIRGRTQIGKADGKKNPIEVTLSTEPRHMWHV